MNLLLVYPGLVEGFASYDRGNNWFNHGVGILSAVLKAEGHSVRYVDCRKLKGWKELEAEIAAAPFDAALLSVATVDFDPSQRIASIIKSRAPGAPVIVGGPHPTLMTEETLGVPDFDVVFTHEAEITLPRLLRDLPSAPRLVRGEMPADLDVLPFVDRELAPEGEFPWYPGLERPYFSVTASRGCLYRCTFCQPAERFVFGDKVRRRSVDNVLDELVLLRDRYGMRSFMIHDDCFTQYYEWVEEFCAMKRDRGLGDVPFVCQTRADIVCRRPDLLERLRDTGLRWVLVGFESGSDRILRFIRKGVTVEQNLRAARICRALGVRILANYMFGLPTETREEMRMTVDMIREIDPDMHSPSVFTPAPGSHLYDYCSEHGLNLINSSEGYRRSPGSGAKIRGVDYGFVNLCLRQAARGATAGYLVHHLAGKWADRLDLMRRASRVKRKLTGLD